MSEINLISAEQKNLSQTRKIVWVAVIAAGAILIISLISAAAVYSLHLVKTRQIGQQELLVTNLQQKLTNLGKIEQRQFLIYDRLDSSQKVLASRPELKNRLDRLVNTFPADVSIENIKITGTDKSSEIMITSSTFAGFFDTFKILRGGGFSAVNFDGINRDKNGMYQVKIIITL